MWPSWSAASAELMEWDEDIKQMKSDMASSYRIKSSLKMRISMT